MVDKNDWSADVQTNVPADMQHDNFPCCGVLFTLKTPSKAVLNDIHNTQSETAIQMKSSTTK